MYNNYMALEFQVPQFIEVEDKIFGPFTLKQFLYLAGGAGAIFLLYTFLPIYLMIVFAIPVGGLSFALAFYKVNEQPFVKYMENAIGFNLGSKIYIWRQPEPEKKAVEIKKEPVIMAPELTRNRIKELAWSLDIKEKTK